MKQRQKKNRVLRRKAVREDELAPGIAAGITQGEHALEEANERFPVQSIDGVTAMQHMTKPHRRGGGAGFVAQENFESIMVEEATGRVMRDVTIIFPKGVKEEIQAGYRCLRCHEPQDYSFPEWCDLCGYPMRERQIMDVAMEFDGERHLGPTRPIQEFLDAQDARLEKRKFIKRVLDGGQGKVPKEWLQDEELLAGLAPEDRAAIGALR